jgi:hypothetical protein
MVRLLAGCRYKNGSHPLQELRGDLCLSANCRLSCTSFLTNECHDVDGLGCQSLVHRLDGLCVTLLLLRPSAKNLVRLDLIQLNHHTYPGYLFPKTPLLLSGVSWVLSSASKVLCGVSVICQYVAVI